MKGSGLLSATLVTAFVLALPARGAEPAGDPKRWVLSFTGLGPVRIGMPVREAERALKTKLHEEQADDPDECHYASNEAVLPGVAFMLEHRKIVRIDVNSGAYRTSSGVQIGMTEEDVRKRHPNVVVEQHQYDPSGHYLTIVGEDGRHAIVFETDGKMVTNFRGGERGPVAYVEGCL